jgi:hypothetical protein
MKRLSTRHLVLVGIVLLSILGGVIAIYATANGPWGYTDPVEYISVARSLLHGQGFGYYEGTARFTPEAIHASFYPVVLSLLGLLGGNLVAVSRWLNICAFIASIFIAGWIFYRFSRVPALGIIASALMCGFPWTVVMFSSSYSEPLFILLFLAGALLVLEYLRNPKTTLLIASALVIGLVPCTRYPGIAMVISAGLTVWGYSSGKPWKRIQKALLFTFIAGLPVLVWLVWVYFSTSHGLAGRSANLDFGGLSALFQTFRGIFVEMVWRWLPFQGKDTHVRYFLKIILLFVGILAIVLLSWLADRRSDKKPVRDPAGTGMPIFVFFGLTALVFTAVVLVTYLFSHPLITLDDRILLPLFISSMMAFYGAWAVWQAAWFAGRKRILQLLPWIVAGLCLAWYIPQTWERVSFYHHGDGLTAYSWNRADMIQAVRALPADKAVISNDWELTTLWTGRPVYAFWNTFPAKPPIQTTPYGTDKRDSVQTVFCSQAAALVIYNDFETQARVQVGEASLDPMAKLFDGLSIYGKYSDGTIYLCP